MPEKSSETAKIENVFKMYMENKQAHEAELYELLFPYLTNYLLYKYANNPFVNEELAEDVVQDCLIKLFMNEFEQYKDGYFLAWCKTVVAHRLLDSIEGAEMTQFLDLDDDELLSSILLSTVDNYMNPEKLTLKLEYIEAQFEFARRALNLLMTHNSAPYRVVGACFSLVLFHKFNPKSTRNSSPEWGLGQLYDVSVEEASRIFVQEMNEWLPELDLHWSEAFVSALNEEENGVKIKNMVFGELFEVKDLENWSTRLRKSVKKQLFTEKYSQSTFEEAAQAAYMAFTNKGIKNLEIFSKVARELEKNGV